MVRVTVIGVAFVAGPRGVMFIVLGVFTRFVLMSGVRIVILLVPGSLGFFSMSAMVRHETDYAVQTAFSMTLSATGSCRVNA